MGWNLAVLVIHVAAEVTCLTETFEAVGTEEEIGVLLYHVSTEDVAFVRENGVATRTTEFVIGSLSEVAVAIGDYLLVWVSFC